MTPAIESLIDEACLAYEEWDRGPWPKTRRCERSERCVAAVNALAAALGVCPLRLRDAIVAGKRSGLALRDAVTAASRNDDLERAS